MLDRNRIRAKRRRSILIAVTATVICGLLAALTAALFVIDKLNKNNLFIKSILVDNNYILNMNTNNDNEGAVGAPDRTVDAVAYAMRQLGGAIGGLEDFRIPMKYLYFDVNGYPCVCDHSPGGELFEQFEADCASWMYGLYLSGDESGGEKVYGEVTDSPYIRYSDAEYRSEDCDGEEDNPPGIEIGDTYYVDVINLQRMIGMLERYFIGAHNTYSTDGVCPASDKQVEDDFKSTFYRRDGLVFDSVKKKSARLDVPYISQEGILPNGCESVSATMLLQYLGFDISPETFVDKYLEREPVSIRWGCRYGPNPKLAYAGDPRSKDSGYGCFAPVIVRALNKFLADEDKDYRAINVSGMSLEQLKREFIDHGIPIAVWVTVNMEEIDKIILWQSTDRSESFMYPANEHCMVFCGYDDGGYIFADPYNSNGIVRYTIDESVLAYNSLNMQAVVILDAGRTGGA